MSTFKNVSGHPIDIPLLGLHVGWDTEKNVGETFSIEDTDENAHIIAQFEANPAFDSSRVRNPDTAVSAEAVATATGPVPTIDPASAA